jgi:hypothetical protein
VVDDWAGRWRLVWAAGTSHRLFWSFNATMLGKRLVGVAARSEGGGSSKLGLQL